MKNRLFVNNNTIILFLFIIGSFLFIELNFRYWYRFLEPVSYTHLTLPTKA